MKKLLLISLLLCSMVGFGADSLPRKLVYTFPIRENIMPSVQRISQKCLAQASEMNADIIIIELNTYGGLVDIADSIRTSILNSPIPVWVWIDNQAVSAGALIALAADSVYIRQGGSIGAASVVDQSGKPLPDKFQSFMRATMRATAEAHGKVVDRIEGVDTTWRWHRDPQIAESMVGVTSSDSTTTKVLTFTADEAVAYKFSEAKASSVKEVLEVAGVANYDVYEYAPTFLDKLLGLMMNPVAQGLFVMLIVGGIYFELQTPGIGFPLVLAIIGAVCYFAPLYLEGLAQNWELILFVAGLILIGIEIFVLPGFGVAGISGIVAIVLGLTFAAINNDSFRYVAERQMSLSEFIAPFFVVIISISVTVVLAIFLSRRLLTKESSLKQKLVLTSSLIPEDGWVGHIEINADLIGKHGFTSTPLRPAGRVTIGSQYYEASAENGLFIEKNVEVRVVRIEGGIIYCRKAPKS